MMDSYSNKILKGSNNNFRIENIKKKLLTLLLDKKLDFAQLLNKIDAGNFQNRELPPEKLNLAMFLDMLLEILEKSDTLINAEQFLDNVNHKGGEEALKLDGHTNELKENFYEIFQLYFGEEERLRTLELKNRLFEQFMNMKIKDLLT